MNKGAEVDEFPQFICENEKCDINNYERDPHYHQGINALMLACQKGDVEVVQYLLEHEAEIDASLCDFESELNGLTPMMFAARASHWNIVKLLVDNGSNINKTRSMYDFMEGSHPSPLMYACAQGDMSAVKDLIELGANVNITAWETYVPTLHDSSAISALSVSMVTSKSVYTRTVEL